LETLEMVKKSRSESLVLMLISGFMGRQHGSDVSHVDKGTPGGGCLYSPPGPRYTFPAA